MATDTDADTEKETPDEESKFELSPEEATSLDGGSNPGRLNRKRILIFICISLSVIIGGGLIMNALKTPKKKSTMNEAGLASNTSTQVFLASLRDSAASRRMIEPAETVETEQPDEPLLPPVTVNMSPEVPPPPSAPPAPSPPPSSNPAPSGSPPSHFRSPLVPAMQGTLFSNTQSASVPSGYEAAARNTNTSPASYGSQSQASEYALQNDQSNKQSFMDSSSPGGFVVDSRFLGENALWQGTVIPGILITAINTDLPGNVLARVTQNIYDSQTGRSLLIPQGTVLLARYNSSVSYAQHRVQIIWDTIIRPDGLQLELGGANGVDRQGMSGQQAIYDENWFEYLKAAGIIAMFSIANSKMVETAARYASEESPEAAANVAASGAQVTSQLGENIISRALNIQPRLTVDNGTVINIFLNKSLYLPPVSNYPVTQRYILE